MTKEMELKTNQVLMTSCPSCGKKFGHGQKDGVTVKCPACGNILLKIKWVKPICIIEGCEEEPFENQDFELCERHFNEKYKKVDP